MRFHPESPDLRAEDISRLKYVADLKKHLYFDLGGGNRGAYRSRIALDGDASLASPAQCDARREEIRGRMEKEPFFQAWSCAVRAAQDLMWRSVAQIVDRDLERLASRYAAAPIPPQEWHTSLDGDLPSYLTRADIHRMPGSYHADHGPDDVRAGALYDLGGAVYQLGLGNVQGAMLNDTRGHTLVSHLDAHYGRFNPARILDMGCGAGHNSLPLHRRYPAAECHAIDLGASMVRYAHLRASGLGARIHFSRQNAERTAFADGSFDLVVSQILLHETSPAAAARIVAESRRLLRPGGVAVHLEVPVRYEHCDVYDQFFRSWEQYYNNEPNIAWVASVDFRSLAAEAGFTEVLTGYQRIPGSGGAGPVSALPVIGQGSWYVVSGKG